MASGWSRVALGVLLALAVACRVNPAGVIDSELASCVPPEARLLVGVDLDQVRANPALQKVTADWLALLAPARVASTVLVAYTGSDLLWAARGQFRSAPPGATLLNPQLAVGGPAALVHTATAQHASGRAGAPALMAQAEAVARQPIWGVVTGTAPLPLSGNAANLTRLLAFTDYTTLALNANSQIGLHLNAICGSADRARRFEESLRGLLSLARGTSRDRDLTSVLATVQIRRDDGEVRVEVSATPELVAQALRGVAR